MDKQQKGAVTIFLVMILMASFMFGGFFIDSARILVAKRHVKNAINSAARSTLSYYDESLVGEYGLFAFDGTNSKATFDRYLANNLTKSADGGMKFFQYKINSTKVTPMRPLAGAELERQIVEYEKYRGPVNITLGVVEKLKKMFGEGNKVDVEEVDAAKKSIDTIKGNFKDKDNILSSAKNALKVTIKENIKTGIQKDVKTITVKWVNETLVATLNGENGQYVQAEKQIQNAKDQLAYLKKQRDDYVNAAKALCDGSSQENTTSEAKQYLDNDKTLQSQADEQITQLETDIATAERILGEVKSGIEVKRVELAGIVGQLEKKRKELSDVNFKLNGDENTEGAYKKRSKAFTNLKEKEETFNTYTSIIKNGNETIEKCNNKITELNEKNVELDNELYFDYSIDINDRNYEDNLWGEYKRITSKNADDRTKKEKEWIEAVEKEYKKALVSPEKKLIYQMMQNYKQIIDKQNEISKTQTGMVEAQNNIGGAQQNYLTAKTTYEAANNHVIELENQRKSILTEIATLEGQVSAKQTEMKTIADRMGEIPDLGVKGVTVPSLNTTVETLANKTVEYVDLLSSIKDALEQLGRKMSEVKTENGESVVDTQEKNILTMLSNLTTNIKKIASICTSIENLRNEMYFIDYVMDKNTFLTSQTERSHYFELAEVEYIIYGKDTQLSNVVASLATIYGLRFVIDSIDYFFDAANSPELISRIVVAITRGAVQAGKDILDMLIDNGGGAKGCALCPSLTNVRLSYSDHLRIFLLLNAGTSKDALKNAMSTTLVEEKQSKDMDKLYTQLSATVEVEVNLLILPMIGSDLLPNNYFRNGSYVINETVVEGYE